MLGSNPNGAGSSGEVGFLFSPLSSGAKERRLNNGNSNDANPEGVENVRKDGGEEEKREMSSVEGKIDRGKMSCNYTHMDFLFN